MTCWSARYRICSTQRALRNAVQNFAKTTNYTENLLIPYLLLPRNLSIEIHDVFYNLVVNQLFIISFLMINGKLAVPIRNLLCIIEIYQIGLLQEGTCCILRHPEKRAPFGSVSKVSFSNRPHACVARFAYHGQNGKQLPPHLCHRRRKNCVSSWLNEAMRFSNVTFKFCYLSRHVLSSVFAQRN